jgi:hypothetical protein
MAMNGNAMGTAVVSAIQGIDSSLTAPQLAQLTTAWQAICGAIVTYIEANAVVPPGIAVQVNTSTGTGATTGPGSVV